MIYSPGTQMVAQKDVMEANDRIAHPAGAVGVIVRSPVDRSHAYRVKFSDGLEAPIHHDQLTRLADFKAGQIRRPTVVDEATSPTRRSGRGHESMSISDNIAAMDSWLRPLPFFSTEE